MQVLKMGEVSIIDLETQMRSRATMEFQLCQGHNQHGLVEARIKVVQTAMEKMDLGNQRLHATGLQTWFKLIESDLNSCPFGVTMAGLNPTHPFSNSSALTSYAWEEYPTGSPQAHLNCQIHQMIS